MNAAVALVSSSLWTASPSAGLSDAARFIDNRINEPRDRLLRESVSVGYASVVAVLLRINEECRTPGWDGDKAPPISTGALYAAERFILALPLGTPRPSVGAEPDGQVTFEWYRSPRATLSVSVDPQGLLHYSAMLGGACQCGTEPFLGQIPRAILDLIRRVRQP